MFVGRSRIAGTSLLEVTVGTAVGVVVVVAALAMLGLVSRGESFVRSRADAADVAINAESTLSRDLAALQSDAEGSDILVSDATSSAGTTPGGRLEFSVLTADGRLVSVNWSFDKATGNLWREVESERPRSFPLGSGALVRFARVDPSFAHGQAPTIGQYNNRLVYRVSVAPLGGPGLTLMGTRPLHVKASHDTFPFWNTVP